MPVRSFKRGMPGDTNEQLYRCFDAQSWPEKAVACGFTLEIGAVWVSLRPFLLVFPRFRSLKSNFQELVVVETYTDSPSEYFAQPLGGCLL